MRVRRLPALLLATVVALGVAGRADAATWLCHPGLAADPCRPGLTTTTFTPAGEERGVQRVRPVRRPRADCFYVYPTVSGQPGPQADLAIDPELRSIALYQAARYSRDCRVFAPVYRQITLAGLFGGGVTAAMGDVAYGDVRDAWREYLRRHNRGRSVVLIGHSQGTFMLRRLVTEEIDRVRSVRRRLVSAVLLGGNVTVARGRDAGGDFRRIPACRRPAQTGCVIAFSAFAGQPPADARFGRTREPGLEVLCTNPAALRGGTARITPVLASAPFAAGAIGSQVALTRASLPTATTPWLAFPDAYTARCDRADGANVLRVAPRAGAPAFPALPTAAWGLHLQDANVALGELAALVRRQIRAHAA